MEANPRRRAILLFSTLSFTLLFAVWLMFGVLGIPIRKEFGLTDFQLAMVTSIAILNGSLWRLSFGIWADRYGGRKMMLLLLLLSAVASWMVSRVETYHQLLICAFLVGIAGNSFAVGISWNSASFSKSRQGFALGVFGAGNVGASVTKFIGPALIALVPAAGFYGGWIPGGWRFVPQLYAVLLVAMALALFLFTPGGGGNATRHKSLAATLAPLRDAKVWRFSLYYVMVFGAYVALSVWLPKYYVDVYGLPLAQAALLTATFIFPASLLRPFGGWLSDRYGARRVMYWVFGILIFSLFWLSLPPGHLVFHVPLKYDPDGMMEKAWFEMPLIPFSALVFMVGCGMGIGKAAVYKYIPDYFPNHVGAVGGLVGLLGALGGFLLPPLFALAADFTAIPQTTFAVLLLVALASFGWMHWTVWGIIQKKLPELREQFEQEAVQDR
jgi:NNP family nitrate/nitrite transporter-like MFS transporter